MKNKIKMVDLGYTEGVTNGIITYWVDNAYWSQGKVLPEVNGWIKIENLKALMPEEYELLKPIAFEFFDATDGDWEEKVTDFLSYCIGHTIDQIPWELEYSFEEGVFRSWLILNFQSDLELEDLKHAFYEAVDEYNDNTAKFTNDAYERALNLMYLPLKRALSEVFDIIYSFVFTTCVKYLKHYIFFTSLNNNVLNFKED